MTAFPPNMMLRDAAGNIFHDTMAERIIEHNTLVDSVAARAMPSSTLPELLRSYSRSVAPHPGNELVHLIEIRDPLKKYYGGEQSACAALNISLGEWQRLGILANVEP